MKKMSNNYSYKYLYTVNNTMYIESDDPNLTRSSAKYLPQNIIDEIVNNLKINTEDRTRCSFFCRYRIEKHKYTHKSPDDGLAYSYIFRYPRLGGCEPTCKKLLRLDDFTFDNFVIGNKINSNMYEAGSTITDKDYIMNIINIDKTKNNYKVKFNKLMEKYQLLIEQSYNNFDGYLMPIFGICYDYETHDNNNNENNNNDDKDTHENMKSVGVVMPKCDITLREYLVEKEYSLVLKEIVDIGYSIARALNKIHNMTKNHTTVHRNVMIENIFGFSTHSNDGSYLWVLGNYNKLKCNPSANNISGDKGSYLTSAPEQVINFSCSDKSDIWSLGVILYQLISKKKI